MKNYAFVTLFMHNPQYIYGVLAMGYSLKLTKIEYSGGNDVVINCI